MNNQPDSEAGNQPSEEIVDINHASLEDLLTLPGIGKSLAERIIAGRPYGAAEELRQVKGVGERLYERILPHLSITLFLPSGEEQEEPDSAVVMIPESYETPSVIPLPDTIPDDGGSQRDSALVMDVSDKEIISLPRVTEVNGATGRKDAEGMRDADSAKSKETTKGPRPVRRRYVVFLVFTMSILAIILAVVLSLGILGGVNGTLRYASLHQVFWLEDEVEGLSERAAALEADVSTLNAQVEALEALNQRVEDLESGVTGLQEALEKAQSSMDTMDTSLDDLSTAADALEANAGELETVLTEMQTQLVGSLAALEAQQVDDGETLVEIGEAIEALEIAVADHAQLLADLEAVSGQLEDIRMTPTPEPILLALPTRTLQASEAVPVIVPLAVEPSAADDLQAQIQMLKVMQILSRGRLYLAQTNYGLVKQDIEIARETLLAMQAQSDDLESLDGVIERLIEAEKELPDSPMQARNNLETAWQMLLEELPLYVVPGETPAADKPTITRTPWETITPSLEPEVTITKTPWHTPTPSITPTK